MKHTSFIINYPSFSGDVQIRTMTDSGEILISLTDVMVALAAENKNSTAVNTEKGLMGMVHAVRDSLDEDEYKHLPFLDEKSKDEQLEIFISEPGLYRVISQDNSPSCKNFQRFIFHDVLPSIRKFGTYPAPLEKDSSEIKSLATLLAQNTNILLKEIEEREKLAVETNKRFEHNEKQLMEISLKLCDMSDAQIPSSYSTVENRCNELDVNDVDSQHLWGMCTKLSIEKNVKTKKTYYEGRKVFIFSTDIIDEAIKLLTLE